MRKFKIRYLFLVFAIALVAGTVIKQFDSSTFVVVKNSGAYAPTIEPESENSGDENVHSKININTATAAELTALDGIGETIAQRIVDYRTQKGRFEVVEDIMKVNGIGKKKFAAIKDYIVAE